jgi:hypothetical protein
MVAAAVCFEGFASAAGAQQSPLAHKGDKQCGINFGYGFSAEANDMQFASMHPYMGWVVTDPLGESWYRGTFEVLLEGAFSYVFKNQRTYSAGANILARYNFLTRSDVWRPYVQAGFGVAHTNLVMDNFGSNINFVSSAACGLQYFLNKKNAVSFEWRFFHMSNAGLDDDNSGLNMNNFFLGLTCCF